MTQFMQYPSQSILNSGMQMNCQPIFEYRPQFFSLLQDTRQLNPQFNIYFNIPLESNNFNFHGNTQNIDLDINSDSNEENEYEAEEYSDYDNYSDIDDTSNSNIKTENEIEYKNEDSASNYNEKKIDTTLNNSFEDNNNANIYEYDHYESDDYDHYESDNYNHYESDDYNHYESDDYDHYESDNYDHYESDNYDHYESDNYDHYEIDDYDNECEINRNINDIAISEEEKDKLTHSLVNILSKYLKKVENLGNEIKNDNFNEKDEYFEENEFQENEISNEDIEFEINSFILQKRIEYNENKLYSSKDEQEQIEPNNLYNQTQFYEQNEDSNELLNSVFEEEEKQNQYSNKQLNSVFEEEEKLQKHNEYSNEQTKLFVENEENRKIIDHQSELVEEEEEEKYDEQTEQNKLEEDLSAKTELSLIKDKNKSEDQIENNDPHNIEEENSSEKIELSITKEENKFEEKIDQDKTEEENFNEEELSIKKVENNVVNDQNNSIDEKISKKDEDIHDTILNKTDEKPETIIDQVVIEFPIEPIILVQIKSDRNCSYDNINENIERGIPGNPLEKEIEQQSTREIASHKDDITYYESFLPKKTQFNINNKKSTFENKEEEEENNPTMNLLEHSTEKLEDMFHFASAEENVEKVVDFEEEEKKKSQKISIHELNINERKQHNSSLSINQNINNDDKENEMPKPNINENGDIIKRSINIEDDHSSSQELNQTTDDSITNSDSSTNSQNKPKKPKKLTFAPQEPTENQNSKQKLSSSPRRNHQSSTDDIYSMIHEPKSSQHLSPRLKRIHEKFNARTKLKTSKSSSEINNISTFNIYNKISYSDSSDIPKKDATIIVPNPDEIVHIPSSRSSQSITMMAPKSVKISPSLSRGSDLDNPTKKKKIRRSSFSSYQLPPDLQNVVKKARQGEPLYNVTIDQFKKILFALNDERKNLAREHKYKEGLVCNSIISHVNKYYEIAKKKLNNDHNQNDVDSNELKLAALKKRLDFFLVQGKFKEADAIQIQIDKIKSEMSNASENKKC